VVNGDGMIRKIAALGPEARVELQVSRGGKPTALVATLGERGPEADAAESLDGGPEGGETTADATPHPRGDALGLVIEAVSGGAGARAALVVKTIVGLDPGTDTIAEGDVVLEVNRTKTPTLDVYRRTLAALPRGERAWVLLARPGTEGSAYLVGIHPEEEE
jgi:S1-C subfamily serine protease